MKNYLIFLFVIVSIFLNAQVSNSISINWTDKKEFLVGDTSFRIPQFETINFVFDSSARSILYATKIYNVGLVSETDFEISNLITEDISPTELTELNLKSQLQKIDFTVDDLILETKITDVITRMNTFLNSNYPDSILGTLFKDSSKCTDIIENM